jgi:hypothetical protein
MVVLPKEAIERIEEVSNLDEYKTLEAVYEGSPAPVEIRDEALRVLRATHPEYDTTKGSVSQEVIDLMKEGEPDTSDIGGMN